MYLIHIAFCIWSAVSPPLPGANDWSHTGFIACIKAFHASKFVGVLYTIGGVFWALESLWSFWVLKTVRGCLAHAAASTRRALPCLCAIDVSCRYVCMPVKQHIDASCLVWEVQLSAFITWSGMCTALSQDMQVISTGFPSQAYTCRAIWVHMTCLLYSSIQVSRLLVLWLAVGLASHSFSFLGL